MHFLAHTTYDNLINPIVFTQSLVNTPTRLYIYLEVFYHVQKLRMIPMAGWSPLHF